MKVMANELIIVKKNNYNNTMNFVLWLRIFYLLIIIIIRAFLFTIFLKLVN